MSTPSIAIGIQCRLSSSRLPAKALLSLADTTVLGMCILRAKNTGYPVFVLTSDQHEDDLIAKAAAECAADGTIRGSLENVMSRYLTLSQKVSCDYIVRVTADNPLTEYGFIEPLARLTSENNLPYAWVEPSLCPEGSNIEVFSRQALYRSAKVDRSESNLVNVTSHMRRNLSAIQCLRSIEIGWRLLDCAQVSFTIDTLSDYVKVAKLVDSVTHERGVCWRDANFVRICAEFALSKRICFPLGRNHILS